MQLSGGVQQNVYQNWDKDGNIFYTDENGNRIQDNTNLLNRLVNNARAGITNLENWINKPFADPSVQKEKQALALGLLTAPLGMGKIATQAVTSKIAPYVGQKIAQNIASGIGGGIVGGGVSGAGEAVINDRNPIIGALSGATIGGLTGGVLGYGLGQIGKNIAQQGLLRNNTNDFAQKYFNDYIEGLTNKTRDMAKFRGLRQSINQGDSGILYDMDNPRHIKQAELINKYNPAPDSYHTWVRTADDIHNFEDTLKAPLFDEDFIGNDFDDSYTWDMAQDAIKNGEIDVYSSYPIENGTFVTPSYMEAQSYAGNNNVYSKKVPLQDVAWIDERQGQYAPIKNINKSLIAPLATGTFLNQLIGGNQQ